MVGRHLALDFLLLVAGEADVRLGGLLERGLLALQLVLECPALESQFLDSLAGGRLLGTALLGNAGFQFRLLDESAQPLDIVLDILDIGELFFLHGVMDVVAVHARELRASMGTGMPESGFLLSVALLADLRRLVGLEANETDDLGGIASCRYVLSARTMAGFAALLGGIFIE